MHPRVAFPTIVGGVSVEMSIAQTSSPLTAWERVICAVDLTRASVHAALEAARLMPPAAKLTLCTVVGPEALKKGVSLDQARTHEAQQALEQAQAEIQPFHDAELHLREGPPIGRLLEELRTEAATLVAVGSHGLGHAEGTGLGSVATAMIHEAPCAVLIAPGDAADGEDIVVGFDGSGGARRALAAGRELCGRMSLTLRVIVATGDAHPPGPGWSREELEPGLTVTEDPRTAVEALTDASHSARLLILGSRHLRGVIALSSVSERASHRSSCPILLVR